MKGDITLTDKHEERYRENEDHFEEEYAAEIAPNGVPYTDDRERETTKAGGGTAGFIALALAVLSLFTFPVLFGLLSVLVGIYAYNRGATVTGGIAAVMGGIAAIVALIFRAALIGLFFSLF
ncbi:imidazole glycerol phosphate synthase [Bacillus multifaciens]|uniref:imidazole glycerol phosphate synthase n=1 Tax=Bacillus multifaciens TaxID=3068506 RepID=UPI002740CC33|nr:imidazole glycerol phosphate synthase [Bacillus sp. WLY-B-L8]MDP7979398.1 imidazole glycerol phosphate synthase [Bacillus sp. WLY-B-L8]HDX9590656.1 imidazole glycerol phosphate synthase [Bacillus pseudomycoides]